jgi:hypothetical protein
MKNIFAILTLTGSITLATAQTMTMDECMAVSKQIIRLHGGTLRLAHNNEEKVTFLIVLE